MYFLNHASTSHKSSLSGAIGLAKHSKPQKIHIPIPVLPGAQILWRKIATPNGSQFLILHIIGQGEILSKLAIFVASIYPSAYR